jgi:hypothetical protein
MKSLMQWVVGKPRLLGWLLGHNMVRVRDNDRLYVRLGSRWMRVPVRVKVQQGPEDFGTDRWGRAA